MEVKWQYELGQSCQSSPHSMRDHNPALMCRELSNGAFDSPANDILSTHLSPSLHKTRLHHHHRTTGSRLSRLSRLTQTTTTKMNATACFWSPPVDISRRISLLVLQGLDSIAGTMNYRCLSVPICADLPLDSPIALVHSSGSMSAPGKPGPMCSGEDPLCVSAALII